MKRTGTLIIGGGQAGLAMSRSLMDRGIDHVVLERGRVGERWRSERWDSLRLLTPNWQTRLPGWSYAGPDPDGFMGRREVIDYLESYARSFSAPVEAGVTVLSVEREGPGYRVETDAGTRRARTVVIATGSCDRPFVPALAGALSPGIAQVVPTAYRNPSGLPQGGVLVVGASATGLQLADEIHRSGRPVTLAVGRHTRLPRSYRGRDIQWWLDAAGIWDETASQVHDLEADRREPSLQLVGSDDHRSLDLGVLQDEGVRLAGRVVGAERSRVLLDADLEATMAAADARLARLLRRFDTHAEKYGIAAGPRPAETLRAIAVPEAPSFLDLIGSGIRTVVWATGFRRSYPWLRVEVLDARGEIRHEGGVTDVPGLYVLGLQFLRTRKSSFIDGVGADAAYLAGRIAALLGADGRAAA